MKRATLLTLLTLLACTPPPASAQGPLSLKWHNFRLLGQLRDHTDNHGVDRRIWSKALGQWRKLYVYLPPNYDPCVRYPLILWLHGVIDDERTVRDRELPHFDQAIASGRLPPSIVVIPDGRIPVDDRARTPINAGELPGPERRQRWDRGFPFDSFFVNNKAGRYEDYLLMDVLPFVKAHYPIRPERAAHVIMGFSLSGWAAYAVALKNTDVFGIVMGFLPPLNMRWVDCHGNYHGDFDPGCWGWRNTLDRDEVIGTSRSSGARATLRRGIEPYFGWGDEGLAWLSWENPIEQLERCDIRPGEITMYVGYIRQDEFNLDAQVESFLHVARRRGLCVKVDRDTESPSHSVYQVHRAFPRAFDWLGTQLRPYSRTLARGPVPIDRYRPSWNTPRP